MSGAKLTPYEEVRAILGHYNKQATTQTMTVDQVEAIKRYQDLRQRLGLTLAAEDVPNFQALSEKKQRETLDDIKAAGFCLPPLDPENDPRITQAVIDAASVAGLKAKPSIEAFARAAIGAALVQIETVDNDLTAEVDRLRAELDTALTVLAHCSDPIARLALANTYPEFFAKTNLENESGETDRRKREARVQSARVAHVIANEIIVKGFDNDAGIENVIRGMEPRMGGFIAKAFLKGLN